MKCYKDVSDFYLYHQPIVDLYTGKVVGTEALLRMKGKNQTLEPIDFFSDIKDRIDNLDVFKWVVIEALNHIEYFRGLELNLRVSVNVSSKEMLHPGFLKFLHEVFSYQKEEMLTLEITEDYTDSCCKILPEIIMELSNMGISTSIDDFGKRLSNFDRLLLYPVDSVKIDKIFTSNITHSTHDMSILSSMIDIIKLVGKKVIVEGIECIKQAEIVCELGCSHIQGFGIGRPMHHKDLPLWIKRSYISNDWWTSPSKLFNYFQSTSKYIDSKLVR